MNMDCEKFMQSFLLLDNGEKLSPDLAAHLKSCARCAARTEKLLLLMESRAAFADISPRADISSAVMARISREAGKEHFAETRPILSLRNWIGTGLFILLGMLLIPFSTILPQLVRNTPWLDVVLPLVLGTVMTIYSTLFTGSHIKTLDRFLTTVRNQTKRLL
jgi:hypothetical protein